MILWFFAANCNDHISILIHYLYIDVSSSNSICSSFYFYINSIARLSQVLVFSSILFFKKNAHKEGIGRACWRAVFKNGSSRSCVATFTSTVVHCIVCVHKVAVVMISLFILKIWKNVGKLCQLINYCQAIDNTRIIENTGQVIRPLYKPCP